MLLKKTMGILIILANTIGVGFLIYQAGMMLKERFFSEKPVVPVENTSGKNKKSNHTEPTIKNDHIIPDEDDLLKDMDLSDLDDLDFDDFK
jgi:hypothetical protein